MSGQVLASSYLHQNVTTTVTDEISRRTANFHPSIWGDKFISLDNSDDDQTDKKLEILKEIVKNKILCHVIKNSEKLDLIDEVQRLGLSYHFEDEIEYVLRQIYMTSSFNDDDDDDLYNIALRFRLLRQQGYNISCDVFKKFINNEGKFKESLASDIQGMLSLYEASFLRVHGEEILEEALSFTSHHLRSMVTEDLIKCPILLEKVTHALKQPIRKGLTRIEARHFMSVYQQDPSHNSVLLNFAKLDFNLLQKVHQEELSHIARWWKELDFATKLPFARDRVIECYFWILGVYFEPQFAFARRTMTKVIAMTSIIDDIFDVYGTLEELELFTQAAERWDIDAIDKLPEYMKYFFKALLDVYIEIEDTLAMEGEKLYRVEYAKEAMKRQIRAYLKEAKWFHAKYVPNFEEYMRLSLVTSGYSLLATTSYVGMDDIVTKESFEWLASNPKILTSSEIISRLMDDIVSHKFEQERGHVASAVECYMKQHIVVEEEAVEVLRKKISSAWKDINEEFLYNYSNIPMPLMMRILNMSRVMEVIYKHEDGYTNSHGALKDFITSILIQPISE